MPLSSAKQFDGRKSDSFRANTSKTKLESLLGKEFKHPRRKCSICGYNVSYSNFKRHLRNAHPQEYIQVSWICGRKRDSLKLSFVNSVKKTIRILEKQLPLFAT